MKPAPNIMVLAPFILLLFASSVFASDDPTVLVPLPSVDDFSAGKNGWSLGLGLGIEYESAYEGSDEFGFEPQPAGALQWRSDQDIFYFAGEAFGWRGLRDARWLVDLAVGFEEGREESDSDKGLLDELGDQEEGFQLVLQARHAFTSDWRYWLVGRVVASEQGNLALFGAGRRFGDQNDGSGSEVNLVLVAHDSQYANSGFGVDATQAQSSRLPETYQSAGLRSVGIDYNFRYIVNSNWQIYAEALFEYFSSDIKRSPLAQSDYEAEVGVGFIYVF